MQAEGAGEPRTRAPSFSFLQEGGQSQSVGAIVSLITSATQSPGGEGLHGVWWSPAQGLQTWFECLVDLGELFLSVPNGDDAAQGPM